MHRQATNVMRHLETKREAGERRHVDLMSKGIAKFLEKTSVHNQGDDTYVVGMNKDRASQPASSGGQEEPSAKASVLDKIRVTLDHAAGK